MPFNENRFNARTILMPSNFTYILPPLSALYRGVFKMVRKISVLKWYYDQKITFIFSSDFETMFVKHSPSEIISVNFEKKTVSLNCNFPV